MSEDWPGTLPQQQAVRDAFKVEHGTVQHQLLQKIDREINLNQRHYLPIAFVTLPTVPQVQLGRGFATGILLSTELVPAGIPGIVQHEFGHVYDQIFLDQADKDWFMGQISTEDRDWRHYSETFADAVKDWWRGVSWSSLTPLLLS